MKGLVLGVYFFYIQCHYVVGGLRRHLLTFQSLYQNPFEIFDLSLLANPPHGCFFVARLHAVTATHCLYTFIWG
jgi:hypothetical protein